MPEHEISWMPGYQVFRMPPRVHIPLPSCPYAKGTQRYLSTRSPRLANSKASKTTSTLTLKGQIPPESPKFIDIPRSLQPQQIYRPWVKGVLPVPREIFPRTLEKDKTSLQYLTETTADPKSPPPSKDATPANRSEPQTVNYITYKYQQSAARRRNLRESLVELHQRKQHIDRQVAARSAGKHAQHLRLAYAPEPDDERLTNPSVPSSMRPSARGTLPDPNREARVAQKRANVAAKQAEREEERRNMLHTLYMNAKDFIIDSAQLENEIDRAFDDDNQFTNDSMRGQNVWNLGLPETVQQMLSTAARAPGGRAVDRHAGFGLLEKQRLDRIAEELTGGKIKTM